MRIMERVKSMIRNWLEIQSPSGRGFTIREPVNFETNVIRNRIWYRGDASELDQLFKALAEDKVCEARFWAAAPKSETIRKAHSGLPGIIVDTFVALVTADLDDIDFDGDEHDEGEWALIAKENKLPELISTAIAETLVTGDGAFKLNIDTDVSTNPILEYWGADSVDYVYSHGRVQEVHFISSVGDRGRILKEIYKPGSITYKLMQNDRELPLDAEESTADLRPVEFNNDLMLAVPMRFWPSSRWRGRGQSLFDRKTDAFDAHDEVISQWMDAVRSGRVQKYIPEDLIPRNASTGALLMPDSFGTTFIKIGSSNKENANDKIETTQPEIRYEAFLASYTATLNMCLQGIMSPATLGIDVGKMSSAEAQREKKDVTGITRNAITRELEDVLPKVAQMALAAQDILNGGTPRVHNATVTFGEYGAPDFDSRVQTVGSAAGSGVMSIEAQVDELWGSSKDDDWKKKEVARIRYERGITELPEPDVGTGV